MCILPNRPLYRDRAAASQPQDQPFSTTTILHTCKGIPKLVRRLDPVWDTLDSRRYRFNGVMADGMIELRNDDGTRLPDLRQPEQVLAY